MIPAKNETNLELLEKAFHSVKVPEGMQYQLPPNTFRMLKGEFLDYKVRKELSTKFYISKNFSNPQGTVQGGIIAACFDDTFGPLGVVNSRKPILTIDMNIQYIRSIPLEEEFYILTEVISASRSTLFLEAKAYNTRGKLLAKASSNQLILQ
ncbi:MAG: PaaI family thioesterase [Prolixibacteraceae bacterium]|jgi:acyl-coenzyme A thioesterase PaaI-like protein|nr:PaaI family thioesterase [Prolixibacteraceae bacterium]